MNYWCKNLDSNGLFLFYRYRKVASIESIELSDQEFDGLLQSYKAASRCLADPLPELNMNSKVNLFYKF